MFGPRITPSGRPADQVGHGRAAARHDLVERALAGKAPPTLPMPVAVGGAIASITDCGTWVPAAPSR